MTMVQERAVFEKVELRFCECCAGEAFTAAPALYVPPSLLLIFLTFFGFDAQVGCGVAAGVAAAKSELRLHFHCSKLLK